MLQRLFLVVLTLQLILAQQLLLGQVSSQQVLTQGNTETVQAPQASLEQNIKRIQQFNIAINSIIRGLEAEVDTTILADILPSAERIATVIQSRLDSQESRINLRYINALDNLLSGIKSQLNEAEKPVLVKMEQLLGFRTVVDSIKTDGIWQLGKESTIGFEEYTQAKKDLSKKLGQLEKSLQEARMVNANYLSRISRVSINLALVGERIQSQRRTLERSLLDKENNYLWEKRDFPDTERLLDIFKASLRFNGLIVSRYITSHMGVLFFLLTSIGVLYWWTSTNIKKIEQEKEFASIILGRLVYIHKFTLVASSLLILAISPFFFTNPPVTLFAVILFFMVSFSGILLTNRINKPALKVWGGLFILFVFSLISNLYWEISYNERWYLLAFGIIAILLGLQLKKVIATDAENSLPPYLSKITNVYIGFQAVAILANILGRFSLAKMLGITATLSLMHAVSLLVFLIVIKEMIYLQIEVSRKNQSEFTSMIDFKDIQQRITKLFSLLAIAIWGYYFFESLSLLDTLLEAIGNSLAKPRNILNASFTFGQVAVFILVVYISSFLANNVAYFASIKDQQYAAAKKKRLGSAILLLRLGVLSVGFLIAIAASGIPVDKIAIVLGALSVGIGFGLQTIVNNLVSGIILAFEKPIEIGDIIQVGTIEGTVSDIGIRASKIKNYDGAEIIIPNGDLLAQQLTNWTLSDKKRRVELIIGVGYQSDPDLVTQLIYEQLTREGILTLPVPRVYLQTFADNSINFRVLFWVDDIDVWIIIRDEVMRAIFKSFKTNNIEIPFPQRDLHIKSYPGVIKESVIKPTDQKGPSEEDSQ
ncbi:mechanosensitive ion channel family protein [Mongoliitalea lutea]|uniref:Mechanosensitive ion channel n=1 Tax=Mongoliitalea lutea TaxID=849756 RepID=A0A8J3CV26_9BACT|nr:mechanosensitive ion channel domain-containing protein [Mongoliitalea lutea]GHB33210.1 hypothetical protein GCM10008106_12680 [Mongoliitalea lutea]